MTKFDWYTLDTMSTKLTCQCNLTLDTEDKGYLLVTFIQRLVTKCKLSPIFTETLLFPHKTAYFLNDRYDSYKNADCNSKSYVIKLIPFSQLTFWTQTIIAEDEIKVSVILASKCKVHYDLLISCPLFTVTCCNTSTISFFIFFFFFFEDSSKASKEQKTKTDILTSWRYSAESNSKRQVELRCNSAFPETEPSQLC